LKTKQEGEMSNQSNDEMGDLEIIAETANYAVLVGSDVDGEQIYNIELGTVTIHLFEEEWEEIVSLIRQAASSS
jgi:hypothetical protein